ncbi:transposase [Streptomyces sp. NPDC101165]|uniref:transposase n=1 Tax=Streptomyces sp. NPDC101165 TaxID=3366119 RepID=UPI00382DA8CE
MHVPLVVADAGYGDAVAFRMGLNERGLNYVVGICTALSARPGSARPSGRPKHPSRWPDGRYVPVRQDPADPRQVLVDGRERAGLEYGLLALGVPAVLGGRPGGDPAPAVPAAGCPGALGVPMLWPARCLRVTGRRGAPPG